MAELYFHTRVINISFHLILNEIAYNLIHFAYQFCFKSLDYLKFSIYFV